MEKLKRKIFIESTLTQCFGNFKPYEIEETTVGTLYQNEKGVSYIVYESNIQDQKVITTVKINNDSLSLIRIGDVHSRQIFTEGKWHTCYYYVTGNSLILRSYTKRLEYYLNPDGGCLNLLYDLWSGQSHIGHFCFDIVLC
jgi:uncharacterized beta-barrel protein YwiB (DUF1934 family)